MRGADGQPRGRPGEDGVVSEGLVDEEEEEGEEGEGEGWRERESV